MRVVTRHREHDAVSREVRSWYTAATPDLGISVVPTPYGYLTRSDRAPTKRLILTADAADQVPDALDAAMLAFDGAAFEVWVDERSRADRLAAALASADWEPVQDTVVLALVGPIRDAAGPDGLTVEEVVDDDGLRRWATTKIQGFADREEAPTEDEMRAEMSSRQSEWPVCRYLLGRLDGQDAAILGHYRGDDQMVFLLTTRMPFRHRGVARAMLERWSLGAEPVRSLLINGDDGGPAADLYRRLGFTDEVYWHRRYARPS